MFSFYIIASLKRVLKTLLQNHEKEIKAKVKSIHLSIHLPKNDMCSLISA